MVELKDGTTEIIPGLSASWEVSEDGLTGTFKPRAGVKFHGIDRFTPTRDMNAEDVIFSFDRQGNAETPCFTLSGGTWEYHGGMSMPDLVESISAPDPMTVVFTLWCPKAPMIADTLMGFASIVSTEYADAMLAVGTPEMVNQTPYDNPNARRMAGLMQADFARIGVGVGIVP